ELPTTVLGVLEGQLYVYTGYLLTLSALLILAGALSDYYGRRRIFLIGLVGFGLTSVLCGLAPNMEFLVVSRVLQGAAGAILVPGSLALITANFTGEAQGRAYGVWAAATAATTILGPFIGGLLVDTTFAFPYLMARSREPLVPLDLFKSRNFTVTNISTFLIYGALYVTFYYLALFLQGVLGYSAAAAGLAGIPGGLLLVFLSTRF